jgi:enamine deaminase RidA (YjgF/YER057c/UK114 family)
MLQTNHAEVMEVVQRTHVSSGSPFEAKIGYSRAVRVGDQVFVSGTTAMQDGKPVAVGDAGGQTRHILGIILGALQEAGATASNVVRYRIYLTNIDDWPAVLEEMSHVFGSVLPTATLVEVKGLVNAKSLVEIEVDAIVGITE